MAAINSRSLGDRRAYTGCLRESRDADSAFCLLWKGGNIYDTRKINDTLYISRGEVCVRDKERIPACARIFPAGGERERSIKVSGQEEGIRSFVKMGDVDDLKIDRAR